MLERHAAERQAQRRLLGVDRPKDGAGGAVRIAGLSAVQLAQHLAALPDALLVVGSRVRPLYGLLVEKARAERSRLDDRDLDAEVRHFRCQRLREAFDPELTRG